MWYSWIYVFVNALSAVLRQISGRSLSPAIILLLGSSVAVLYYHLINLHKLKFVYQQCWLFKWKLLSLSLTVAIIWLCAVYSPVYIGASLYTFIFFSLLGICGMGFTLRQTSVDKTHYRISFIGLVSLVVVMIAMSLHQAWSLTKCWGIVLALLGGVMGFVYAKQSYHLMQFSKLKASQILAVRFYLTIIFSALLVPTHELLNLTINMFMLSMAVGVFCLIIPLYFIQKGIEKVGPERNSIISSSTPFVTTILEQWYFHDINMIILPICLMYSLFSVWPFISRQLKARAITAVAKSTLS